MLKVLLVSLLVVGNLNAEKIKVFFGNGFKNEKSELQPFDKWYSGSDENKYTLSEMYEDGWKIEQVVKTNAGAKNWQMSFFMTISDKNYRKVKSKYEEKQVKKAKNVSVEEGL